MTVALLILRTVDGNGLEGRLLCAGFPEERQCRNLVLPANISDTHYHAVDARTEDAVILVLDDYLQSGHYPFKGCFLGFLLRTLAGLDGMYQVRIPDNRLCPLPF